MHAAKSKKQDLLSKSEIKITSFFLGKDVYFFAYLKDKSSVSSSLGVSAI